MPSGGPETFGVKRHESGADGLGEFAERRWDDLDVVALPGE
jgi:hypothetical protein